MAKQHFTHPNHLLFEYSDDRVYICKGCNNLGSGKRYRCNDCDFDLHKFCANCPLTLLSPLHQHELHLITRQLSNDLQTMTCAVCDDSIDGLIFYRCDSQHCDFNVHTLCTQFPDELRHVIDKEHPLKLYSCLHGVCVVCKTECSSSSCYSCAICQVNIHISCLLKSQPGSSTATPEGDIPQCGIPLPEYTGRTKRFFKKMAALSTTLTLGVVSSIICEMLGY